MALLHVYTGKPAQKLLTLEGNTEALVYAEKAEPFPWQCPVISPRNPDSGEV